MKKLFFLRFFIKNQRFLELVVPHVDLFFHVNDEETESKRGKGETYLHSQSWWQAWCQSTTFKKLKT